jgi:hypothetical protein
MEQINAPINNERNTMTTKDGFVIEWSAGVARVTKSVKDSGNFDADLQKARALLCQFKMGVGSEWGCDGVGYDVQKKIGLVRVNRSGVSSASYQAGCAAIRAHEAKAAA